MEDLQRALDFIDLGLGRKEQEAGMRTCTRTNTRACQRVRTGRLCILRAKRFPLNLLHIFAGNVGRFLGRLLGLSVEVQNTLFNYFMDCLSHDIAVAEKVGVAAK